MSAKRLITDMTAPDIELMDTNGKIVRLSDFRGKRFVLLVLMRGFA